MIYKIFFYGIILLLFILGVVTVYIVGRGGSVILSPIPGFGLLYQKVTNVYEDQNTKEHIYSHNIIIGILFIYLVIKWDDRIDPNSPDNELKLEKNAN